MAPTVPLRRLRFHRGKSTWRWNWRCFLAHSICAYISYCSPAVETIMLMPNSKLLKVLRLFKRFIFYPRVLMPHLEQSTWRGPKIDPSYSFIDLRFLLIRHFLLFDRFKTKGWQNAETSSFRDGFWSFRQWNRSFSIYWTFNHSLCITSFSSQTFVLTSIGMFNTSPIQSIKSQ